MARWIEKQFAAHSEMFGTRQFAVFMAASALIRVVAWALLIFGFILQVGFVVSWFDSVAFVSVLSALALLLTDWAQFAASAVGLSVVERGEAALGDVGADIDRLVELAEAEAAADATEAREVAQRVRSRVKR
jgi:hypothetical protein